MQQIASIPRKLQQITAAGHAGVEALDQAVIRMCAAWDKGWCVRPSETPYAIEMEDDHEK